MIEGSVADLVRAIRTLQPRDETALVRIDFAHGHDAEVRGEPCIVQELDHPLECAPAGGQF